MAIFVNYRREDSLVSTGRLDDNLRREFGDRDVYRDIDSIPLGVDFSKHITIQLSRCDVMLVVIGNKWLSPRLQNPKDYVRMEIEAALSRDIRVIPVLVESARLPDLAELPPSMQPLLTRNALSIDSGSDFKAHFAKLALSIRAGRSSSLMPTSQRTSVEGPVERSLTPEGRKRWRSARKRLLQFGGLLLGVLLLGAGVIVGRTQKPNPGHPQPDPSGGAQPAPASDTPGAHEATVQSPCAELKTALDTTLCAVESALKDGHPCVASRALEAVYATNPTDEARIATFRGAVEKALPHVGISLASPAPAEFFAKLEYIDCGDGEMCESISFEGGDEPEKAACQGKARLRAGGVGVQPFTKSLTLQNGSRQRIPIALTPSLVPLARPFKPDTAASTPAPGRVKIDMTIQ